MPFQVSYTFFAKNQFSNVAKKINESAKAIHNRVVKINKVVKKGNKHWLDMADGMKNAGLKMSAFVSAPVLLGFNKMINMASDAEETSNKFAEVFKGLGDKGNQTVKNLASDFKLASSTSKTLLSDTGDLLVGLGFTREQALQLSDSVVRLSGDVASFKNVEGGTARAANALTKALLGEREMLKETFKTAVLEADVKERATQLAIQNRSLTEKQAKALATLQLVTERNKDAIGDFNRTSGGYANLTRINQELTKEMAESFGTLLLPMAIELRKGLIKLTDKINNLSPTTKKVILVILGLMAVIGPLLLIGGFLISTFVSISAAAAIAGISIGAVAIPILLIVAAIGLVIAAIVLWIVRWDDIVGGAKLLWEDFTNFLLTKWSEFVGFAMPLWDEFTTFIIDKAITIANAIKDFLIFPLKTFGKLMEFVGADKISSFIDDIDKKLTIGGSINSASKSQTDININVQGQPGTVSSAKSKTTGDRTANIGFNVIEAF